MEFAILNEFHGVMHSYKPDFLMRLATMSGEPVRTVILEIKGLRAPKVTGGVVG